MRSFQAFLLLAAAAMAGFAQDLPEQRIAYTRQGTIPDIGLYISLLNGKETKKVADLGMASKWSPDGTRIAYSGPTGKAPYFSGPVELFIYDLRTAKSVMLTHSGKATKPGFPAWSPDGKRIAYAAANKNDSVLSLVDVTTGIETTVIPSKEVTCANEPSWSPNAEILVVHLCGKSARGLALIDTTGKLIKQLTQPDEAEKDGLPAWAPDGKSIAFTSTRGDGGKKHKDERRWSIYVVNPDGTNLHPLVTHKDLDVIWPAWSSDGTMLAYQLSRPTGGSQARLQNLAATKVVVMRLTDGTVLTTLPDGTVQPSLGSASH